MDADATRNCGSVASKPLGLLTQPRRPIDTAACMSHEPALVGDKQSGTELCIHDDLKTGRRVGIAHDLGTIGTVLSIMRSAMTIASLECSGWRGGKLAGFDVPGKLGRARRHQSNRSGFWAGHCQANAVRTGENYRNQEPEEFERKLQDGDPTEGV